MRKEQNMKVDWRWRTFKSLTVGELDEIYCLRQLVFVVEQNCPYLDADGKDKNAIHLLGYQNNELIATLRFFPEYQDYAGQASLGRVCTAPGVRRSGIGRELMSQAVCYADQHYPTQPVQIGAQSYLEGFYFSYGFKKISEEYLEDGIPHILMRRAAARES